VLPERTTAVRRWVEVAGFAQAPLLLAMHRWLDSLTSRFAVLSHDTGWGKGRAAQSWYITCSAMERVAPCALIQERLSAEADYCGSVHA
jgi:hypothetical protein